VSEIAVNSALSMIESEQPRNETECAIVIQMACVHSATMAVLGRIGGGHGGDRHVLAAAIFFWKVLEVCECEADAYAAQMRALVAARQCPPWYEFNKLANGKRRRLPICSHSDASCYVPSRLNQSSIVVVSLSTLKNHGSNIPRLHYRRAKRTRLDRVVSDLSHVSRQSSHDRRWRKAIEQLNSILAGPLGSGENGRFPSVSAKAFSIVSSSHVKA
jgi:hypothetical protein